MRSNVSGNAGLLAKMLRAGARGLLAVCVFVSCAPGAEVSTPAGAQPPGAPVVFVVDSTNTLQSFDVTGTSLQKMKFKSEIGDLNGGIALAMGKVYVTWVKGGGQGASGGVFAFDSTTLRQVRLHLGAFAVPGQAGDPGELHGIIYDPRDDRFFVATDHLGLLAFDRSGTYIPRAAGSVSFVSTVAYDSTNNSLWGIVNHAVVPFSGETNAPLPGHPIVDIGYRHGLDPVALAFCAAGAANGGRANAITVAFAATKAGARGAGAGHTYETSGIPIGSSYGAQIINPHGISCSSRGEIFIAADNGMLKFTLQGAVISPSGDLRELRSPIRGVFAAY